jgi:hypothetical protein
MKTEVQLMSPLRSLGVAMLIVWAWAIAGCGSHPTSPQARAIPTTTAAGRAAQLALAVQTQNASSDSLLARTDVVGTGASLATNGSAQVLVLMRCAPTSPLPSSINGVPVVTQLTGTVQPWAMNTVYRPLVIGVSAGNANECVPGTIGCVVMRGSRAYLLSANHVFARQNQALLGENIVQPSMVDLSSTCAPPPSSAVVAQLTDFTPVSYDGKTQNTMDAAIAEVSLPASQVSGSTPPGYYGFPSSTVAPATEGMAIQKLGRTTLLTRGQVKAVNVKTKITFPSGTAVFVGQIMTSPGFGGFGDSGSLVVTDDGTRRPVGLLIGGSNNGSGIVTPIGPVLSRFAAVVRSY